MLLKNIETKKIYKRITVNNLLKQAGTLTA